jgi:hypothetical protein
VFNKDFEQNFSLARYSLTFGLQNARQACASLQREKSAQTIAE